MPSLGQYIQTAFAATETTDFHTQMDLVGEQVVLIIQQLYSTKTNPYPTGCYNALVSTLQPTDPPRDSNTLAYYVTQGFALGLDPQLVAAQTPPPFPYVLGSINTLMQAKILEGVIALQLGSALTPQVTILITAFDSFLVEKFAVPI